MSNHRTAIFLRQPVGIVRRSIVHDQYQQYYFYLRLRQLFSWPFLYFSSLYAGIISSTSFVSYVRLISLDSAVSDFLPDCSFSVLPLQATVSSIIQQFYFSARLPVSAYREDHLPVHNLLPVVSRTVRCNHSTAMSALPGWRDASIKPCCMNVEITHSIMKWTDSLLHGSWKFPAGQACNCFRAHFSIFPVYHRAS